MQFTVNGRVRDVEPAHFESLASTLRERLHLLGTKVACERGECGACTVLLDGTPVYSCIVLTRACEGRTVGTIEGVARPGELHPLQEAFIAHDAVQCGFCTPGQIMSAVALLERCPDPDDAAIARAMSGNLCRCGTYPKVLAAVKAVAGERRAGGEHGG
jgi:aerobic-type carbon monoxide dehydrogenase small subunit (CoxS/CutS family)